MTDFSPKRASETEVFTVDFVDMLPAGVTISVATWSIARVDGIDSQASSMLQGSASISSSQVSQKITAGIPGARYAPKCTALTSDGQTLILPEYGEGMLFVTE